MLPIGESHAAQAAAAHDVERAGDYSRTVAKADQRDRRIGRNLFEHPRQLAAGRPRPRRFDANVFERARNLRRRPGKNHEANRLCARRVPRTMRR